VLELRILLENGSVVSYMGTLVADSYGKFEFPTVTPGTYTALIGYILHGFGVADITELRGLGWKNEMLVDVRDSLDNEFVDLACQAPVINVQGGGQFAHLLQAHIGAVGLCRLALRDCLPTTTTRDMLEIYRTLVALFQSVVLSVMPLMAVYTADVKCQNKQS
jgi:hypothetical protein